MLSELVAAAGLRVVTGDPGGRAVGGVELVVPAGTTAAHPGDAPPAGARPRADAGGVVLLVAWAPLRRGGALPPLRPLLAPLLAAGPAAVLVAPRGGRVLHPPADAVDAARRSGVPLLWAPGEEAVEALFARLRGLLGTAPDAGAGSRGEPAGGAGGGSSAAAARAAVRDGLLEGPLDVHRLTERIAVHLAAVVSVTDAADRDVARHDGTAGRGDEDGHGGDGDGDEGRTVPDPGAEVVASADGGTGADELPPAAAAPLVLRHGERRIGLWHVHRERPLEPDEMALLDATAPVLVLALRVFTTEERAEAPVQELLVAVLGEDLAARERAVRRSKRLVVFPARSAVFLVVAPYGADVAQRGLERLARSVEPAARAADPRAVVLVHEGSVVMLLGADTDLDQLQRAAVRRVNVPLALGAGRAVGDVRGFAGAYRQAQRAAVIARRLGSVNRVRRFDDLGVHRLLHQLPEHERRAFVLDVLGPAAGTDAGAAEARRVLRAYRAANGNATAAARQLFLHHNTFRQRLVKLAADVGDLDDADVRMAVFVALDLHRLDSDSDREG